MAVSFTGVLEFKLPQNELNILNFWLEFSSSGCEVHVVGGKTTLQVNESLTKQHYFMHDIGIFINKHGKFLNGKVHLVFDCDTEQSVFVVEDFKLKVIDYFYDEEKKNEIQVQDVISILEKQDKINNVSSDKLDDDSLLQDIFDEYYDSNAMQEVVPGLECFIKENGGIANVFLEKGKIQFTSSGIYWIPFVPALSRKVEEEEQKFSFSGRKSMMISQMEFHTTETPESFIRAEKIFFYLSKRHTLDIMLN